MKKIELPIEYKIKSLELDDAQIIKVLLDCAEAINELIDLQNNKVEPKCPMKSCNKNCQGVCCCPCHTYNPTKTVDELIKDTLIEISGLIDDWKSIKICGIDMSKGIEALLKDFVKDLKNI